jgi:predicted alpha/beta superfamily hydrolase
MPISRRFIEKWLARGRQAPGTLDIIPNVHSPVLGNSRDILVYLPSSYERSDRRLPVIYMHDGQNLFDPTTSFAGEWGVDRAIARSPRKGRRAIVVGIPNMGVERMREYSPFYEPQHGGGAADDYIDFLTHTVKPLIDERYRTLPDREFTGIHGSSLGGLLSLYAFFRASTVFGFAGAMSPALWFGERRIFPFVEAAPYVRGRLYLDVGTREGENTLRNARAMRDLLLHKGYQLGTDLMWVEDRGGMHNEAAWGRRLTKALPFLLAETTEGR